ncbi:MAG: YajG family lipoprotein [Thermodesulfobacteriota bacterium]
MFTRIIIPLAIVLIFSGCAFAPQAVLLKPDINIRSGNIGSNKPIILNVIDERTKTTLGTRAPNMGADLTIEGDIVETVSDSLSKGLLAQGFQITKSANKGTTKLTELRVELRALEYRVITGFWSGTL